MNKGDLINEVVKVVSTKKEAQAAIDCIFTTITKALKNAKPITLPIKSERIRIRKLDSKKDRSLFERWLEDDFGRYFLLSRSTATSLSLDEFFGNESNIIGIITLLNGKPIGSVAYLDYDVNQFKAELRKLIGETDMRGRGYAKEATALWLEYGAVTLDLRKIYLNTFNTNIRNISLNEELGFHVEGILRNEMFFEGEFKDILRMGFFRE